VNIVNTVNVVNAVEPSAWIDIHVFTLFTTFTRV